MSYESEGKRVGYVMREAGGEVIRYEIRNLQKRG